MTQARIMVVEDSDVISLILKRHLGSLDYDVVGIIDTGEEALQRIESMQPDLVLMDINLAGEMNGIETAEQIRQHFGIPVIYLTAHSEYEIFQQAKVTEPYGYILKPFEKRDLQISIEIALYKNQIERRLGEHEKWLETILDNIGDAVIATDPKGYVRFMNPVAESLTGWQQSYALGKTVAEIFDTVVEDIPEVTVVSIADVARHDEVADISKQTVLIARDGSKKPIDESVVTIRDDHDNDAGEIMTFRDISQRQQAERHRIELAIEKERAGLLEKFIGGASHDLRTPLSAITLALYVLQNNTDPDTQKRSHDTLRVQTKRLGDLLEDMLSMARLDGVVEFKQQTLSLNTLIQNILIDQQEHNTEKAQTVSAILADELPLIHADLFQLSRAITNIVVNASHYTPKGGSITVRTYQRDQFVVLEVEDDGIGIGPKDLPHIFERFYRVDKARGTAAGGTGLGLAISKKIIETHQGSIEAESELGKGSLFRVILPIV
jgi:PAS domain S-box-containing protein